LIFLGADSSNLVIRFGSKTLDISERLRLSAMPGARLFPFQSTIKA